MLISCLGILSGCQEPSPATLPATPSLSVSYPGPPLFAPTPTQDTSVLPPTAVIYATATSLGQSPPQPTVHSPDPDRIADVLISTSTKQGQRYRYSCEFDAAWVILQTYGLDVTVDDLIARLPGDPALEPTFAETSRGIEIYGGDIRQTFSGNIQDNFLARTTGNAMQTMFRSYAVETYPVHTQQEIVRALSQGHLVWIKTTVDFKDGIPAMWITPDGTSIPTVLGNDHAVVVMGVDDEGAVIRDVLGSTSSNPQRPDEYHVGWDHFMMIWALQGFDGLGAIPPPNK